MNTLNAPEEIQLAKIMIELHPWAGMVRYARTGGEAMAVAVRIARAKTKKDIVLFCGYHGWHDWYLAANLGKKNALDGHLLPGLNPAGVARSLRGSSFAFNYNDVAGFKNLVAKHKNDIGVIVMESIRSDEPTAEFITAIQQETDRIGAVLVVDEITAGFRLNLGGAHLKYNIKPDIAVFGKAISNGFPMGIILGKTSVMEAAQDSFISSTYWTDRIGPVTAIATLNEMKRNDVSSHLIRVVDKIQKGWKAMADKHKLRINVGGIFPLSHFNFVDDTPLLFKTLFTQLMLQRGYLASTAFYASYAHKNNIVDNYLSHVDEVFSIMSEAKPKGTIEKMLEGPICHAGFRRLNSLSPASQ